MGTCYALFVKRQSNACSSLAIAFAACIAGSMGAPSAAAQTPSTSFQSEHFEPAGNQGLNILSVTTSRVLPHLMPSVGLFVHYAKDPLVLYTQGPDGVVGISQRLISHQVIGELSLAMGVVDWLDFGVTLPVTLFMEGDDLGNVGKGGMTVDGAAMGDVRLHAKFRFVNPAWTGGLGMALKTEVWFPSGDTERWRGDGAVRFEPRLVIDYRTDGGFGLAVNVGYQFRPLRRSQNIVSDNTLRWGAGIEIPTVPEFQLLLTAFGNVQLTEDVDPYDPTQALGSRQNTSVDVVAAFQFKLPHELVMQIGGGLGLLRAAGSPEARAIFSFGYTPDPQDSDGDGLRDATDRCSDRAEDKDDYRDDDGCPDLDNDADGVPDTSDKCPLVKEDLDGFDDADGCPEGDNDRDGIVDAQDKCPNSPEDMDGFEDFDGCPESDNDNDGVPDGADKCPLKPEDKDGFEDSDGCPELDNDKDGITDALDRCPNVAETRNGYQDDDGCPDARPKKKPKPGKVKVTKTRIEILEKVFFKTGKATILTKSYALLREVAAVVKQHPKITKLRVEGHTDSRGKGAYNRRLSQSRAEAVRDFLIHEGVSVERLVAKGWGEDNPIASNKRGRGRAKNRRVEFVIMEVGGKAVGPGPVLVPNR